MKEMLKKGYKFEAAGFIIRSYIYIQNRIRGLKCS